MIHDALPMRHTNTAPARGRHIRAKAERYCTSGENAASLVQSLPSGF
jgi:hypothetical protein